MDKITIEKLHIYAYHGVHASEKENGQDFYVSAVLFTDLYKAGRSDALEDTVSYSDAAKLIHRVFTAEKYDLIERAAVTVAEALLDNFPALRSAVVRVDKPDAPIGLEFDTVSVEITLSRHIAYIGIGSNMGDRLKFIDKALAMLEETPGISVTAKSSIIETEPYGGVEQDPFLNGVIEISTRLRPYDLLDRLHEIENACGRVRTIHWGPRTLDLDILLYDDLHMNEKELTIPHPDMKNREFVLKPLAEIAPHLIL